MSDAPSDPGTMLKLGLVVLCVGGCALGMLALRQAGLQAGHELAQTQLRIQKADEDLWKLRAEISTLAAPARIRELADKLGPLHGLTPRPGADGAGANPSGSTEPPLGAGASQPAAAKSRPSVKPDLKPEAKPQGKPEGKPDSKPAAKPLQRQQSRQPTGSGTPATKPAATPPRSSSPQPERRAAPGVA